MSSLVVVTADWHVNDTTGLCPPVFKREKGAEYRPGKAQRALWRAWVDFWDFIKEKRDSYSKPPTVYAICNGDLGDINRHSQVELISTYKPDILRAMVDVAQPMLDIADRVFVIRGTAAHTGGNGELDEIFADDIGAVRDEENICASWWYLRSKFDGVRFDFAHHPATSGRRPWTRQAATARQSRIVRDQYHDRGEKPPDVSIFSHIHYYDDSGRASKPKVFFTPPWKWVGAYGYRLGAATHVEPVGGLWFMCEDGEYTWDVVQYKPSRRKIWTES